MRFPANVLSGFDHTMGSAGSTFFDLNDLQACPPHIPGICVGSGMYAAYSRRQLALQDHSTLAAPS